ncbi:hypothetical protein AK830_g11033 [Neonectria ditissima]|uniref:non-specific serine/threonine protein kinase n=1 Tax=Neonectria ditissima TaxID=78410 RepID=A0A0P7B2B9_9HYPO|nr:hypothetical protein AK830_g11033 [Neonectria ditissima]
MAFPQGQLLSLFCLEPLTEGAKAVVAHSSNQRLVHWQNGSKFGLDIGHLHSPWRDYATIATLGKTGDVVVDDPRIAGIQCSFEIDSDTGIVMFYDRSHSQTSQVFGENATRFEDGRPRKVIVNQDYNTIIGMGGSEQNMFMFKLRWYWGFNGVMGMFKRQETEFEKSPPGQLRQTRYIKQDFLGSRPLESVFNAINMDSGKLMVVKRMANSAHDRDRLKLEVNLLIRSSHPHVVDYISSQGWNNPVVEIFMGQGEGTLATLIRNGCSMPVPKLARLALHHMLQAIDRLAVEGIVHRDVKPEDIIYTASQHYQSRYHFQLGDFGLANFQHVATSPVGTLIYTAPEVFQTVRQTHKADVWSLFATMLWTLNAEGFRDASFNMTREDAEKRVLRATSHSDVISIQEMARTNPQERASAAQMLVKCFNGNGLTTPLGQVPCLD